MLDDELSAYLASYDAWKATPLDGWHSMADLPLRAYMVELLFYGGGTEYWPVSNAQFLTSPKVPIAWRNAQSRLDWQRKLAHAWIDKADVVGMYAIMRAIAAHEHKQEREKAA